MIYLAWTRSNNGSTRGNLSVGPIDHGTRDGLKTLCNRDVSGSDTTVEWNPHSNTACGNCKTRWLR
jgi:hypothetical protein